MCIKPVENPFPDSYLDYSLRRTVERAFLQAGVSLSCKEGAEEVEVQVVEFKDVPAGLSPFQRVNVYSLKLTFSVKLEDGEKTYSTSVSYSLPSGAEGDNPRRFAVDDALNIIYPELIYNLSRRYANANKLGN